MASNILQRSLISAFDRSGVARENIEKYIIGLETQIFKELTAEFKAKGLEAVVLTDHAESLH